jgi:hypothetical protein
MNIISRKLSRLAVASALATGIISAGIAASAQTVDASNASAAMSATTVSMSTSSIDAKAKHQAELEQVNADARRIAFRNQGTSF